MTTGQFYVRPGPKQEKWAGIMVVGPSCPQAIEPDTDQDLSLSISTVAGVPAAGDLTPGAITITRVRAGVEAVVVNAAACSASPGVIYYEYAFPSASWQPGDEYKAAFSGQKVTVGGTVYPLSEIRCGGRVSREGAIYADTQSIIAVVTPGGSGDLAAILAAINAIQAETGKWPGDEVEDTAAGLNLNGGVAGSGNPGADVYALTAAGRIEVLCAIISMRNATPGATITVRAYTSVDGAEDEIYNQQFTRGTDPDGVMVINGNFGANEPIRFEMHSSSAADTAVDVPYKAIWRVLE